MVGQAIPELDTAGLRKFGLLTGAIVMGLFGLAIPFIFTLAFPVWPWAVGGTLSLWALGHPRSLRPVYVGWMKFGILIGSITTPLVLALVFYLLFMPVGFLMRVAGKDPMSRKLDANAESYRVIPPEENHRSLERPF